MNTLKTFIGGFCMAFADSVPGVSGGTIAFVMRFYDKFILSLNNLISGNKEERLDGLKFLVKLGLGWIISMGICVTILSNIFVSGIYQLCSLFLGFVIVSVPIIIIEERKNLTLSFKRALLFFLGVGVIVATTLMDFSTSINVMGFSITNAIYVVIVGFLAISAMVLPGISGSTILMSFGIYMSIINAAKDIMHFNFTDLWLVISLCIGVVLGVLISVRGIKTLFQKQRGGTMYAVIGMMAGSIFAIICGPTKMEVPQDMLNFSNFSPVYFIIGTLIVSAFFFLRKKQIERTTIDNKIETKKKIDKNINKAKTQRRSINIDKSING